MQRSTRGIREELESERIEFAKVGKRARQILANAKAQGVDLNAEESAEFDQLVGGKYDSGQAGVIKNNIATLEAELAEAEATEQTILTKGYGMHPSSNIYNNLYSGDVKPVLPVNGQLPENRNDHIFVRTSKLKAFRNERDAYGAGMWMRSLVARIQNKVDNRADEYCSRNGLQIDNTSSTLTGAGGGYLVPAPISQTIIDVRENVGVSRQICQVVPMTSDTLTLPKRSAGLTVYAPGEANAITTSDKTWGQVQLIAKKRATASYLSQELVDDALISIVDNIISEMGYALALQEDNELINGTGADTTYFGVRGLLNRIGTAGVSTAAAGHDTWPELDMGDLSACIGLLPERYHRNPSWVCSAAFYHGVLARLAYAAGGATAAEMMSGVANRRQFMGYPVYLTSQMPTATATATVCALFGSFDMGVVLGDRTGIVMGRDDSTGFLSDLTTLKATSRYDINVHQPGTSSAAGAYVALKTAS